MTTRTSGARGSGPDASATPGWQLAHTEPDGTRTYYDEMHRIAAVIGPAATIRARWRQGYRDFDIYRAADGRLLMLLRFDLGIEDLGQAIATAPGLDAGGWTRIAPAELKRLGDERGPPAG